MGAQNHRFMDYWHQQFADLAAAEQRAQQAAWLSRSYGAFAEQEIAKQAAWYAAKLKEQAAEAKLVIEGECVDVTPTD